jgi:hypothetical protein
MKQLELDKRKQDFAAGLAKQNALRGASNRWDPISAPVHFYLLNGVQSPGLCRFPQLEDSEKWDIITGPGLAGAVPVFRGANITEFEAVHELYDASDWAQFHVFLPMLHRAKIGKRPQAFRILHPVFEWFDPPIRAVVKPKVRLPSDPDERGVTRFSVFYTEFRRLTAQQAKPEAAKPEASKDPYDLKVEELTDIFQAEAGAQ